MYILIPSDVPVSFGHTPRIALNKEAATYTRRAPLMRVVRRAVSIPWHS